MNLRFDYRTMTTDAAIVKAATSYFDQNLGMCTTNMLCRYRRPDGHTCVLGAFIPDDIYHPGFENRGVITLTEMDDLDPDFKTWLTDHEEVLSRLQQIHDGDLNWGDNGFGFKGRTKLAILTESVSQDTPCTT